MPTAAELPGLEPRARGLPGGIWEGDWRTKAGISGTVRVTAMSYPGFAYAYYETSGDPFGCSQGALQGTVMLDQGMDFSETALTLDVDDPILGQLSLDSKGRRVRGGATGTCGGKWAVVEHADNFPHEEDRGQGVARCQRGVGKVTYRVKPCAGDHCGAV